MPYLSPNPNDFARMIDRYNREMQKYVQKSTLMQDDTDMPAVSSEETAPTMTSQAVSNEAPMPSDDPMNPPAPTTDNSNPPVENTEEIPYPLTEDRPLPQRNIPTPAPSAPTPTPAYPRNSVGFLQVQATTARRALPIENATVTVSGTENGQSVLYRTVFTDNSGLTPLLSLPTVSASLSLTPEMVNPYVLYTIQVNKDGFYPALFNNVPIYEGVVARQIVNMIPLPENMRNGEPQTVDESTPSNLY